MLRRSILRHSTRRPGSTSSHHHVILHDEPSESAQKWLETIRHESYYDEDDIHHAIPYIDDQHDDEGEVNDGDDNKVDEEENTAPKKNLSDMLRRSRRRSVGESVVRSSLYDQRMMKSASYTGGGGQETPLSIIGRSATVVEQAEAKRAFKQRNSIKKRMMKKIGKSFESLTPRDSKHKKTDIVNKSQDNTDIKCVKNISATPRMNISEQQESFEHQRQQHSVSDLGFAKLASLRFKRKSSKEKKRRKSLMKDWSRTYEDMCDRAQKLDLAIKQAQTEELQLRPVNSFLRHTDPGDEKRKRQKMMSSFYSLQSVTSSDTEEWDEDATAATCDDDKMRVAASGSVNNLSSTLTERRRIFQSRTRSVDANLSS